MQIVDQKLREWALRKITFQMFKNSTTGHVTAAAYFVIAVLSFFLYVSILHLSIFLSITLSIVTWFVVTYICDKALINFLRIDKTIEFCKTPEGVERLKKIGRYSDEEIKQIQELMDMADEELKGMGL